MFAARGVAATSVDDIVEAAGVAKGTFYLYFSTKMTPSTPSPSAWSSRVGDRVEALRVLPSYRQSTASWRSAKHCRMSAGQPYERDLVRCSIGQRTERCTTEYPSASSPG